jgi:hypothetical protein
VIGRADVVFDQHGNAVQRSARAVASALLVERIGDGQRIGIEFDDGVDRRALFIDFRDALEIFLRDRMRREFSGVHSILKRSHADFVEFKRLDAARLLAMAGTLSKRRRDNRRRAESRGRAEEFSAAELFGEFVGHEAGIIVLILLAPHPRGTLAGAKRVGQMRDLAERGA